MTNYKADFKQMPARFVPVDDPSQKTVVSACEQCGGTGRIHGTKLCLECHGKGGFIVSKEVQA